MACLVQSEQMKVKRFEANKINERNCESIVADKNKIKQIDRTTACVA